MTMETVYHSTGSQNERLPKAYTSGTAVRKNTSASQVGLEGAKKSDTEKKDAVSDSRRYLVLISRLENQWKEKKADPETINDLAEYMEARLGVMSRAEQKMMAALPVVKGLGIAKPEELPELIRSADWKTVMPGLLLNLLKAPEFVALIKNEWLPGQYDPQGMPHFQT